MESQVGQPNGFLFPVGDLGLFVPGNGASRCHPSCTYAGRAEGVNSRAVEIASCQASFRNLSKTIIWECLRKFVAHPPELAVAERFKCVS